MKRLFVVAIFLIHLISGCKKNSSSLPVVTQAGTGGLTVDQTEKMLLGNWKGTDSITRVFYDKNGAVITSMTYANTYPYWGITNVVINGTMYDNIQDSNVSSINPPNGGWSSTTWVSISKGYTEMFASGGADTYVINKLTSTTLSVTHTSMGPDFSDYSLNGVNYSAARASEQMTFTKY